MENGEWGVGTHVKKKRGIGQECLSQEMGILAASTARQVSLSNLSINALRPAAQERESSIDCLLTTPNSPSQAVALYPQLKFYLLFPILSSEGGS
jgi:hypothetical protein